MMTLTISVPRFTKVRCNSYGIHPSSLHHLDRTTCCRCCETRHWIAISNFCQTLIATWRTVLLLTSPLTTHQNPAGKVGEKNKIEKKNTQVSRKSKTSTPTTKIRCQGATLSVALGEGCHTAHALTDAIALAAATRPVTPQGHTAIWILQWRSFWNMKRLKSFTSNSSCIVLKIFRLKLWKFFKDGLSMMFSKHLLVLKLIWVGVTTSMFRAPLHTKEGCKAWTLASVPPEKSKALKKQ